MNTFMITGGAGFIGSNFIDDLFKKNLDIRLINIDNLTYAGSLKNLEHIADKTDQYKFIKADICNKERMKEIFSQYKPNYVLNFAAETHVDRSIINSELFVYTNVLGTQVLLDCAKTHNVKKFIQISTDEVYGSSDLGEYFFESSPLLPNNPYSATKASAELMARAFYVTHGLPVIITRSGNNYGPRQHYEKFIPMVVQRCLLREPIPVYGDGGNIRDWIHVEDHCSAIYHLIHHGVPGEIYNIGSNNEKKNLDLVKYIIDRLKAILEGLSINTEGISSDLIEFIMDRKGHDKRYSLNIDKLKETNWEPCMDFDTGLEDTIKWYVTQFYRKLGGIEYERSNIGGR